MAAIVRGLFVGAGAVSAATVGGFVFLVNEKAKELPEDQRGSLLERMKSVGNAFRIGETIQDEYIRQNHFELAVSLSSKQFTETSDKSKKETEAVQTSYYVGYIPEALRRSPVSFLPIFRYDEHLPVILPPVAGQTHKGFVFAGAAPQIHDSQSWDDIHQANYIRCKSELEVANPDKSNAVWNKYKKVDVLITGTTDSRKCSKFKNALLSDLAYLAASDRHSLDPDLPYSDTRVFYCSENGCEQTGDLTDIPPEAKKMIRTLNFRACNAYSLQKTRLSHGSYKEVGAIAAGTTDENICDAFHFGHMRQILDQIKKI